jgi:hypothetical protein
MNGMATFGDKMSTAAPLLRRKLLARSAGEATMTSGMAAFGVVVGGTSLVCSLLMNRVQKRRARRDSWGGFGLDGGGSIDDSLFGWSGTATLDSSGNPSDGGGDSGGGGEGGGGGD